MRVIIIVLLFSTSCDTSTKISNKNHDPVITSFKTFSTTGKELKVLKKNRETKLFKYKGKDCITHMRVGGSFKGVNIQTFKSMLMGKKKIQST